MNVDKWFDEQSLAVKIILIILPFVGWIMEILIRISAYLRNKNSTDLVLLILYLLLGWTWVPLIIDVVFLATKGHIFLAADAEELIKEANQETVEAQKKEEPKEEEKAE